MEIPICFQKMSLTALRRQSHNTAFSKHTQNICWSSNSIAGASPSRALSMWAHPGNEGSISIYDVLPLLKSDDLSPFFVVFHDRSQNIFDYFHGVRVPLSSHWWWLKKRWIPVISHSEKIRSWALQIPAVAAYLTIVVAQGLLSFLCQ